MAKPLEEQPECGGRGGTAECRDAGCARGAGQQLPVDELGAAGRLLPLQAERHHDGLEKPSAGLLFPFLQLYAVPLGADLAASPGSIAPAGPVLPIPDLSL